MLSVKLILHLYYLLKCIQYVCNVYVYLKFNVLACLCLTCLSFLFIHLVSSPPTDLVVKLTFIDYRPVITLTWNMNVSSVHMCLCTCVHICMRCVYKPA